MKDKVDKGQTNRIVLNLDHDNTATIEQMRKQLKDYPIEGLEEVLVIKDGEVTRLVP